MNSTRYDLKQNWSDPYERNRERRQCPRVKTRLSCMIRAPHAEIPGHYNVGNGITEDISATGIRLYTRHQLKPGMRIQIKIPTGRCEWECFPTDFRGEAQVIRVEPVGEDYSRVTLSFGAGFRDNMDFPAFMGYLLAS